MIVVVYILFFTGVIILSIMGILVRIKKEIGEKKYLIGFIGVLLQRQRMYLSMFGMGFLVTERMLAIFDIEFGITEYVKSMNSTVLTVIGMVALFMWAVFIYVDFKFILPSEKGTITKRDPIISEILNYVKK